MAALTEWQNFYVIFGSAAGALIGLQFVVMALIANLPRTSELSPAGAAFSTPTIVYFATVLFLAGVMVAPWHGILPVATLYGAAGLAGVVYGVIITLRLRGSQPTSRSLKTGSSMPFCRLPVTLR